MAIETDRRQDHDRRRIRDVSDATDTHIPATGEIETNMNDRKMTTGFYRPTQSFQSIPEHIAVMFEDDQTLVALIGASDDDPDNLAETNRLAELFASAPETLAAQAARIAELELTLTNTLAELQNVASSGDPNVTLGVLIDARAVLAKVTK